MKTILALTLLVGCGSAASYRPPTAPARETRTTAADDERTVNTSIACFAGGVWDDVLGVRPDACAALAVDVLGANPSDAATRAAVRAIDPRAVDRIVSTLADESHRSLVLAVARAAREAMRARAAAERVRKAGGDAVQVDAEDAALSARDALSSLAAMSSPTAKVVTLVLAADRLENVRGMPARAKLAAAAPTFEVMFDVTRPVYYVPGAWLGFVVDAAKAAGHAAPSTGGAREREQAAFAGVAAGLADRFEAAAKSTAGEPKSVARAYTKRLHIALGEYETKALASK